MQFIDNPELQQHYPHNNNNDFNPDKKK